jgi:hypothetical protein
LSFLQVGRLHQIPGVVDAVPLGLGERLEHGAEGTPGALTKC